jgi:hypothetical protein
VTHRLTSLTLGWTTTYYSSSDIGIEQHHLTDSHLSHLSLRVLEDPRTQELQELLIALHRQPILDKKTHRWIICLAVDQARFPPRGGDQLRASIILQGRRVNVFLIIE